MPIITQEKAKPAEENSPVPGERQCYAVKEKLMQLRLVCSIFPDGFEVQVAAPLGSAYTPPLSRVSLAEAESAAAVRNVQAGAPHVAAIFTVRGRLQLGNAVCLDSLLFGIGAVFDGLER